MNFGIISRPMEKLLVQGMTEEEIDQLIFLLGKIRKNLTT